MKKQCTFLVVCIVITTASFAQWGSPSPRPNREYGNERYKSDPYRVNSFRTEEDLLRDMNLGRLQERKVQRIIQQFQQAVSRLQHDRYSSAQQKRFQLDQLEQQRRSEIQRLLNNYQKERYNAWCTRNEYSRETYSNDRRYGYGNGNGRW
jgi:hypothetical protein